MVLVFLASRRLIGEKGGYKNGTTETQRHREDKEFQPRMTRINTDKKKRIKSLIGSQAVFNDFFLLIRVIRGEFSSLLCVSVSLWFHFVFHHLPPKAPKQNRTCHHSPRKVTCPPLLFEMFARGY